jgi:DNA-binding PadR family transcriptional regulator
MFINITKNILSMNNRPDEELIEFKGLLTFLILHELKQESLYGEQLANSIGARKGETLTPGTIYPALKRLRKHKLVRYSKDGRKKIYTLTDGGNIELKKLYKIFGRYFKGLRKKIPKEKKSRRRVVKGVKRS